MPPPEAPPPEGVRLERIVYALELIVTEVRSDLAGFKRDLERYGRILNWDEHGKSIPQRVESLQAKVDEVDETVKEIEVLLKQQREQEREERATEQTVKGNLRAVWITALFGLLGTVLALLWPWLFGSAVVP